MSTGKKLVLNSVRWMASVLLLSLAGVSTSLATTPLQGPPSLPWGDGTFPQPRPIPRPGRDFQDIIGQFRQTCEFLNGMQEHDTASTDLGGLHEGEGEQLWNIVESDNTHEALRVWCEYGLYFNDPDRYRRNVEEAWIYLERNPAWLEGENGSYYALHNCGWGLVAETGNSRLYGDGHRAYGRRCAETIATTTPQITNQMQDALMPLVAGWAAGTLYQYGLYVGEQSYCDSALRIARQVKSWIDFDPNRLNNNEIWALCGGTAMWGVLNSLGYADSANTANWAIQRLTRMDLLAGRGQWNNSWNVWYAHAWLAAFDRIGEDSLRTNAKVIIDSLVAQDHDDDGGVPATIGDPSNRDQSWVSAYTSWMGLRNFFELLPQIDLAVVSVTHPPADRLFLRGEPIDSFTVVVQQRGTVERPGSLLYVYRLLGNGDRRLLQSVVLEHTPFEPTPVTFPDPLIFDEAGDVHLVVAIERGEGLPPDADTTDNVASTTITLLPTGEFGVTISAEDGYLWGTAHLHSLDWTGRIPDVTVFFRGHFVEAIAVAAGTYSVAIVPEFPYARMKIDTFRVTEGQANILSRNTVRPILLVMDADVDSTLERYYASALDSLNAHYYLWSRDRDGAITNHSGYFDEIIYYTGNRHTGHLPQDDRDELTRFIGRGRALLVTGQNIADELAGSDFLENTLHARTLSDSLRNARQVNGIAGNQLSDGMRLLLLGNQGANNQTSVAGIEPINGAMSLLTYSGHGDTSAGVFWDDRGAKGAFIPFGLEGVSGQAGTTKRHEVLRTILDWFGWSYSVPQESVTATPERWSLISAYPNPFNRSCIIELQTRQVGLGVPEVFDLAGRKIGQPLMIGMNRYIWQGESLSAGSYFVVVRGVDGRQVEASRRLIYLP